MFYFEIAPTKIFRTKSDFLTYGSEENLPIGTLVMIPLGKKTIPGLVLKKVKKPSFPTKPITKRLYDTPLPTRLQQALIWLSKYYNTPLASVLSTALPRGIEKNRRKSSSPDDQRTTCQSKTSHQKKAVLDLALNQAQSRAISEINSSKRNTILLHGVTGSGKTNVYISLAQQELSKGLSVILLTPEIALTSQLINIFRNHFKNVILLHSEQTEAERHILWENILTSDTPQVIIGPRSALFAPVKSLGLIIIDEAHEPAYVQDQSPKYSALRLASTMSRTILGTATPLITDFHLAKSSQALVTLSDLAIKSDKKATIQLIDLKNRDYFKKHRTLSDPLLNSIATSIKNHTGTMIFHNRRGSAPMTICDHCGWQALCPTCFLPLTLHTDQFALLCHTCGHKEKVPSGCPECHHASILHKGFGTKYLETEFTRLFPNARIARFDADTPTELAMKNIYQEVRSGAYDIIIGTQMIAKGFDFPGLTTLGVVQADSQLSLPDFSSEERTYQLLSQTIGRANRGHQDTEIFIQTYQPNHPVIQTAIKSDFDSFSSHLLRERHKALLPPYSYLLKLSVTYKTEKATTKNIQNLSSLIRKGDPSLSVSQPTPAFHERTQQGFTWQLIVKSKSRAKLTSLLQTLPDNPHLHTTLDPPSLL